MLRLNTLICLVCLALTACIESPPPAGQSPFDRDMAPDLEDDTGDSSDADDSGDAGDDMGDSGDDGCLDDSECPGVCEDGECVACRVGEESGCEMGVCAAGATAAENTCVECVEGEDCTSGFCVENSCVACESNEDCGSQTLSCVNNACVGCATNADLCGGDTAKCKVTAEEPSGVCVECLEDGECDDGVCDPESNQCVTCLAREGEGVETGCDEREVCLKHASDSNLNACVECELDEHCDVGVCDTVSNTCVTCVEDGDCAPGLVCSGEANVAERQCVGCVENGDCAGGVCDVDANDPTNNVCVQCLANSDCAAGPGKVCDTTSNLCSVCLDDTDCQGQVCILGASADLNQCKECRDNGECTSPTASVCDSSNTCSACANDGDCSHLTGLGQCVAGTCRACDVATESSDCGGNVCDPSTFTCTNIQIGNTVALESCTYNSQCESGNACVPVNFGNSQHGTYCLPIAPSNAACGRPYGNGQRLRTNTDGTPVTVCMYNETLTTPEAILAYNSNSCTQPTDCAPEGASCELFLATDLNSRKCTYDCSGSLDCRTGSTCGVAGYCFQ
ncbi:hypothetical protein FRD01_14765 [Microvenator marinus]|uniref:Uncharacterized protein n=1 Tax=Microvenator marinus TaxID=2600177 RepID=A0A5B8XT72_9DELT|nr:hypothetical protein [Microvenator marinus]QED28471.1 hypothetical protein FRD01_14765 [Microvenator marinus]